jgi:hypothetical protein
MVLLGELYLRVTWLWEGIRHSLCKVFLEHIRIIASLVGNLHVPVFEALLHILFHPYNKSIGSLLLFSTLLQMWKQGHRWGARHRKDWFEVSLWLSGEIIFKVFLQHSEINVSSKHLINPGESHLWGITGTNYHDYKSHFIMVKEAHSNTLRDHTTLCSYILSCFPFLSLTSLSYFRLHSNYALRISNHKEE